MSVRDDRVVLEVMAVLHPCQESISPDMYFQASPIAQLQAQWEQDEQQEEPEDEDDKAAGLIPDADHIPNARATCKVCFLTPPDLS